MKRNQKRLAALVVFLIFTVVSLFAAQSDTFTPAPNNPTTPPGATQNQDANTELASTALSQLAVKGRAPKTDYAREQFGAGWAEVDACDMRQFILARDLVSETLDSDGCTVLTGSLHDPYTGTTIQFTRGQGTSDDVQIDHVVALSDAWQKGAQNLDVSVRTEFANDPLNLLATDGRTNQQKSDSDAASWLPPSADYRCRYVARQIAVKQKYQLWVTQAEHDAISHILTACPDQKLPEVS